jgi:AGCS family alanine or glycine:cation symporter
VEELIGGIAAAVWGVPLIALLLGTHVFMTFRLHGIQKHVFRAVRLSVKKEKGATGDVSPFSALMTALAATIGTGNIIGVATAIAAGGPGAIFWMWISGIFGMATKYAESLLSVKYRVKIGGEMAGGPMYVMERGLKMRSLGCVFAFFTAMAAFGVGAMVQANSISSVFLTVFDLPPILTGAVVALLAGFVILGGIKSIARVCNFIIPVAGITFIASNIAILLMGSATIPHTITLIFTSAFTGQAAVGGFAGTAARQALRFGISRGLFSNEAGLGSEPIVAAAAQTKSPVRQALVSLTGTFWDTVVLAALTGVMIVNSGVWKAGESGGALTSQVFDMLPAGRFLLALCLFTFAFATCIGWSYYAEKAVEYLFGHRKVKPYKAVYVLLIFVGALFPVSAVWSFSDIANALMAVPNLFTVLMLSGEVARETKKHLSGVLKEAGG